MPNTRNKKVSRKKPYQCYNQEKLAMALQKVTTGQMSQRKAATEFEVPQSTLSDYMRNNQKVGDRPVGRKPVFPPDVEKDMVETAQTAAQMGLGLSRTQFMSRAGMLSKAMKLPVPWKIAPGKNWLYGVQRRHTSLTIRKPEPLSSTCAKGLNVEATGESFLRLYELYKKYNLFDKPSNIHNMDESHCSFQHRPTRVLANCRFRSTPGRVSNSREGTTFITQGSADGTYIPPVIIVKGKTPQSLMGYNTADGPKGSLWTYQQKAWTEDILGFEWFNMFLKHIGVNRQKEDVHLLVLDSHGTHETSGLIAAARNANVLLFCLPSHTTHFLQPLDRSVFGPFKTAYDKFCSEFLQNTENAISKLTWPGLFCQAFKEAMTCTNITQGFSSTGIYPWDPLAIPACAFLPSEAYDGTSVPRNAGKHPLAWVLERVSTFEANESLNAADSNVLAVLRKSCPAQELNSNTTEINSVTSIVESETANYVEQNASVLPTISALPNTNVNSQAFLPDNASAVREDQSLLIPLESGLALSDLTSELQSDSSSEIDQNIAELLSQTLNEKENANTLNVLEVQPVINFDAHLEHTEKLLSSVVRPTLGDIDTNSSEKNVTVDVSKFFLPQKNPSTRVKTQGGGNKRSRLGPMGRSVASRSRLLTSDEIYNIKVEQEKIKIEKAKQKEERHKKMLEKKQLKLKYHIEQIAKLQRN